MIVKKPGALLLLWVILSAVIAISLFIRYGGNVFGSFAGLLIGLLIGILIYPVAKILSPALKYENEQLLLNKLEKLVDKGNYEKAKKILSANEQSFLDSEKVAKIRKVVRQHAGGP